MMQLYSSSEPKPFQQELLTLRAGGAGRGGGPPAVQPIVGYVSGLLRLRGCPAKVWGGGVRPVWVHRFLMSIDELSILQGAGYLVGNSHGNLPLGRLRTMGSWL